MIHPNGYLDLEEIKFVQPDGTEMYFKVGNYNRDGKVWKISYFNRDNYSHVSVGILETSGGAIHNTPYFIKELMMELPPITLIDHLKEYFG